MAIGRARGTNQGLRFDSTRGPMGSCSSEGARAADARSGRGLWRAIRHRRLEPVPSLRYARFVWSRGVHGRGSRRVPRLRACRARPPRRDLHQALYAHHQALYAHHQACARPAARCRRRRFRHASARRRDRARPGARLRATEAPRRSAWICRRAWRCPSRTVPSARSSAISASVTSRVQRPQSPSACASSRPPAPSP